MANNEVLSMVSEGEELVKKYADILAKLIKNDANDIKDVSEIKAKYIQKN